MTGRTGDFIQLANCGRVPERDIPFMPYAAFADALAAAIESGARISSLFGMKGDGAVLVYAILSVDAGGILLAAKSEIRGTAFPSLTPRCPQAHLFEREIAEQFGLDCEGHPWFRPVRYRRSWTGRDAWGRDRDTPIAPGVFPFYRVEGTQVHEVAVGPVHAGIIEPGHFRFQCHGETVLHLEIALGYQHRGVEEALAGIGPGTGGIRSPLSSASRSALMLAETVSGDSTVAHATAFSQIAESLATADIPGHSAVIRAIALELERLANHTGDLGAISLDVGYLPTASFCGRIRGEYLNLTALLCGNRFGRSLIRPGGVGFSLDGAKRADILARLRILSRETKEAVSLLWNNQSVSARFSDTGRIGAELAAQLGLVGPPARAAGLARDVRHSHPSGAYLASRPEIRTGYSGDVYARALVRAGEIEASTDFVRNALEGFEEGSGQARIALPERECLSVALVEGWRGEVCHAAITDRNGNFARYKIVDPSFHNWHGLACAVQGQGISDFPICNKSFGLSYCGHDL